MTLLKRNGVDIHDESNYQNNPHSMRDFFNGRQPDPKWYKPQFARVFAFYTVHVVGMVAVIASLNMVNEPQINTLPPQVSIAKLANK